MKTILIVDFNSIAKGIKNLDMVLKESNVSIYKGQVTCPGKYFFIIYGDNSDVLDASKILDGELKYEIISGVSDKTIAVLDRKNKRIMQSSVGVMEFFTIPESLKALDTILKNHPVEGLKLILGSGLAGKSYFVITGDTSSVTQAINDLELDIRIKEKIVINNPSEELIKHI